MKILILVLSSGHKPFDKLMHAQMKTWDSIDHPNVKTIFYNGGKENTDKIWGFDVNDSIHCVYGKTLLAFKKALELEWDYIFRTNSSSYISKDLLYNMLETLPRNNYYGGIKLNNFVQGNCIILSRDLVEKIVRRDNPVAAYFKAYDWMPLNKAGMDDHMISETLKDIKPDFNYSTFDYYNRDHNTIPYLFHYKCKSDDPERDKDVVAMMRIHAYQLKHLKNGN